MNTIATNVHTGFTAAIDTDDCEWFVGASEGGVLVSPRPRLGWWACRRIDAIKGGMIGDIAAIHEDYGYDFVAASTADATHWVLWTDEIPSDDK